MKNCDCIVLAPHPDDAALSLGCTLADNYRRAGIINTFTLSTEEIGGPDITALRMAEEQQFASMTGAQLLFLEEPDSNYRGVPWNIFSGEISRSNAERITGKYLALLAGLDEGTDLYIPLAIGRHPDHVLSYYCALAALGRLGDRTPGIFFYEDIPYNIGNKEYLPSQAAIIRAGALQQHACCAVKKTGFLEAYASQLSGPYIESILAESRHERSWHIQLPELIHENLCTIDSLATKDGIRLL